MNRPIVLDAGPLGRIAHPRPNKEIVSWLQGMLSAGATIIVPEIADYEVRRNLLLAGLTKSVERLDVLKESLVYFPLHTEIMRKAAEFWAETRKSGQPTADPKALDGDVILAAQALSVGGIIATENVGHLSRFVEAKHWKDITIEQLSDSATLYAHEFDVEYPLEDFLDDVRRIEKFKRGNVLPHWTTFEITREDGTVERARFNSRHPDIMTMDYFNRRYFYHGTARFWRYDQIMQTLRKSEALLIQHGVIIKQSESLDVSVEFLDYLLNIKLDEETGHIPENAAELYLQST